MGRVAGIALTVVAAAGALLPASPPVSAARRGDPDHREAGSEARIRCVDVARTVGLRFRGDYGPVITTDEGGMIMQRNFGAGAAVGDIDRDGDLDVYLLGQAGHPNALFRNDLDPETGRVRYTEVGERTGVADTGLSRAAQFADLDGDGWLDLVLLNDTDGSAAFPRSRLFRNRGDGTFEDVTEGSGFDPTGYLIGGLALSDVDGDGDLDIYVSLWTMELGGTVPGLRPEGYFPGTNRLYRNDGGFRFTDITAEGGLGGISRDTFTPIFHDFDTDGDQDLYLPVDHREDLYYEQAAGVFEDRSLEAGVGHVGNDMGVAVADVDGNGHLDLFVTNINDPEENFGRKPRYNQLLLGSVVDGRARFAEASYDYGVRDAAWGWGTAFADMDLDGDLDLYAVQGFDEFVDRFSRSLRDARAVLFRSAGPGVPFERTEGTGCDIEGDQRGAIPFDHDRDGDVDLLVTQVGLPVVLLENRTKAAGRSLTVRLDGAGGAGAGSRVDVTVDGRTTSQLVLHGGSYLAGPPLEAVFGLGDAAAADEVRITDARGGVTIHTDVPAGELIVP